VRNASLAFLFVGRSARIAALTLLFVPAFLFRRISGPLAGPRLLHWYFRSCGGAFVKLGQILAMRYDLLPASYCEELSKLLDNLPSLPFATLVPVIEADLRRPLAECYASIETEPLASASIAQVHRARLANGDDVVVKVIRPGVADRFHIDLLYLQILGRYMERFGIFGRLGTRRIVRELVQLTREELDFRREARNIRQMHDRMSRDGVDHYAPLTYPDLCGDSVITMELLRGISVSEMIQALDRNDREALARWAAAGITPQRTAGLLLHSVLEQALHHRLFHADPHAGNLILMQGGTLGWIDFGMLGWLDERLWLQQIKLRQAVAEGNIHAAYQHLLSTLEPLPDVDLSSFESEIKEYLRDWSASSETPGATIAEKSSGFFFLRVFDATRRAGLSLPLGLMRLYRTIIVSDIVMLRLDPDIDWMVILRRFLAEERNRQLASLLRTGLSGSTFEAALQTWAQAPRVAADLIDWFQNRFPAIGRSYRQQLSRFEKISLLILQYSRTAIVFGVWFVIGSRLLAPRMFPGGRWAAFGDAVESTWGLFVALGILATMLFGRLIREFERPD
jgi:ubiquinone biosynthesis protein